MKKLLIIITVILLVCSFVYADESQTDKTSYEELLDKVNARAITNIQEMKAYKSVIGDFVSERFKDCEKGSWYETGVGYLVGMGITDGYGNGTFGRNNNIKVDEFITFIARAMKYELIETEGYWGATYIKTAQENNLLNGLTITGYSRSVTRGEMAQIIANALGYDFNMELNQYKKLIFDFPEIEAHQKEDILIAFSSGIITGYPNKTFKANNNSTRGEAATMIIRLLDETERKVPILESHEINPSIFHTAEIYKSNEVNLYNSTLHIDQSNNVYAKNNTDRYLYHFSDENCLEKIEDYKSMNLVTSNGNTYKLDINYSSGDITVMSFEDGKETFRYQL